MRFCDMPSIVFVTPLLRAEGTVAVPLAAKLCFIILPCGAEHVKKAFDERFPAHTSLEGVYHCVAGHHFACCITHDTRCYIHIIAGQIHVVIFR